MAFFTLAGQGTGTCRVRIGSTVRYVDLVPLSTKADIVYKAHTNHGQRRLRPYVISPSRQYKTLAAAVRALIKERT
jgi:hypothetical protein